jgi:hypothetical protein
MPIKPNVEGDISNAIALDYKELPVEEVKGIPAWKHPLKGQFNLTGNAIELCFELLYMQAMLVFSLLRRMSTATVVQQCFGKRT